MEPPVLPEGVEDVDGEEGLPPQPASRPTHRAPVRARDRASVSSWITPFFQKFFISCGKSLTAMR